MTDKPPPPFVPRDKNAEIGGDGTGAVLKVEPAPVDDADLNRGGGAGAAPMSDDEATVRFTTSDMMVIIGYLANAVARSNGAITALAAGEIDQARRSVRQSGEQLDEILEIFAAKLGPEVVGGGR